MLFRLFLTFFPYHDDVLLVFVDGVEEFFFSFKEVTIHLVGLEEADFLLGEDLYHKGKSYIPRFSSNRRPFFSWWSSNGS